MEIIEQKTELRTIGESIARVELFTDASLNPDDWQLVIHFERTTYNDKNEMVAPSQFGSRVIRRYFKDLKGDPEVLQTVALIKKKAYEYRLEDIAADAVRDAEKKANGGTP